MTADKARYAAVTHNKINKGIQVQILMPMALFFTDSKYAIIIFQKHFSICLEKSKNSNYIIPFSDYSPGRTMLGFKIMYFSIWNS